MLPSPPPIVGISAKNALSVVHGTSSTDRPRPSSLVTTGPYIGTGFFSYDRAHRPPFIRLPSLPFVPSSYSTLSLTLATPSSVLYHSRSFSSQPFPLPFYLQPLLLLPLPLHPLSSCTRTSHPSAPLLSPSALPVAACSSTSLAAQRRRYAHRSWRCPLHDRDCHLIWRCPVHPLEHSFCDLIGICHLNATYLYSARCALPPSSPSAALTPLAVIFSSPRYFVASTLSLSSESSTL